MKLPTSLATAALLAAAATALPAAPGPNGPPLASTSSSSSTGFEAVLRPLRTVEVSAATTGVLEAVAAERGDRIAAGQVLAVLESVTERAELELVRARAASTAAVDMAEVELRRRRLRLERSEQLDRDGVISTEQLVEIRADVELAELALRRACEERELARLELDRARARLEQRKVKSPFDGVILERYLSEGELVDRVQNAAIFRLARLDRLVIDVRVPDECARELAVGDPAAVELAGRPAGTLHQGHVTVVDPMIDAATGTRRVRVALPNPDYALSPGRHCVVRF